MWGYPALQLHRWAKVCSRWAQTLRKHSETSLVQYSEKIIGKPVLLQGIAVCSPFNLDESAALA